MVDELEKEFGGLETEANVIGRCWSQFPPYCALKLEQMQWQVLAWWRQFKNLQTNTCGMCKCQSSPTWNGKGFWNPSKCIGKCKVLLCSEPRCWKGFIESPSKCTSRYKISSSLPCVVVEKTIENCKQMQLEGAESKSMTRAIISLVMVEWRRKFHASLSSRKRHISHIGCGKEIFCI